jgi:adenylosuccinate synthase
MLHAKLSTITKDCFVGAVEIVDNRTKVCYTYFDDESDYEYLPKIADMIVEGQLPFHELPWWFRNDISTYDGSARDEDEYNHYIENHFEKVQQAVREPLEELETKLREAMLGGASTTGEIIDLEEFKKKKTWKPKLI